MSSASVSSLSGSGTGEPASVESGSCSRGASVSSAIVKVILPDQTELELPEGATGLDAARAIGSRLADEAVLVRTNGDVRDLRLPLADGERIQILTTRDREDADALSVLRHSAAHLLAEAARRLYPGTKVAIGPPIENGFYYDFEFPGPVSEEDLARLEEEIHREIREGREWERIETTREEARERFEAGGERYKVELVDTADGEITFYRQGDFVDLCRGPHLQDTRPIKALKLLSLAGAYWRGDERNTQLTRVYGTAFFDQKDLDAHLERLEEAKRRDHRRLGRELDLVHFDERSPGSPLWHPKGMVVFNVLEGLRRRENARRGYLEVKTPLIYDTELWETSGHWEKYRENMFLIEQEEKTFGLKPMNCPGHMLLFGSRLRSYRELPMRFAEAAALHRDEPTGTLHGLLRVRHVTQDDAPIFCTAGHIEDEVFACLDYASYLYDLFGMEARFELSTRPENKLGTHEEWDFTEAALSRALHRREISYVVNEGDGAFYGPKIDLHMTDVLGRSWQMGTIQLDAQMPRRFGLVYTSADNVEETPYVIHRALFGSLERFVGILIEHYGGDFPAWLAPVQVRLLPVGDDHRAAVEAVRAELAAAGVRVEVDERAETVGKRIRDAEVEKIPFVVVWGDRESRESVAVRKRHGERATMSLDALLDELRAAARL
ncbi:MAG: threonine--tRNA ligase [Actinobacteria bacterium]|nr:threonine--tRNA ligase [Actinomycetota bacterium]